MINMNKGVKRIVLSAIFFLCVLAMLLCGTMGNDYFVLALAHGANAETTVEGDTLDTDVIMGSSWTIRDYPERLHATQASVKATVNSASGFMLDGLSEDDPIVNIVPKEYFFTAGNVLQMGDEYGYFIDTEETESGNYQSTVLVFDITTNTDLVTTIDRVIVEVSPVFQYRYVGLTNDASRVTINGVFFGYSELAEPRVVACPSKMVYSPILSTVEYDMTEEFYLKDVSFGASLYNEQALNNGDDGYDPYLDYGSYFTGFDYSYQGKYREDGEFNIGDFTWNLLETANWGMGFLKGFPVIGNIVSMIEPIFSTVSVGKGWLEFISEPANWGIAEIETIESKITATCYYQNRDEQLEYYRDDNGAPALIKEAIIAFDTGEEQSMWYGVGDNVTAYFNISHSALNGRTPYYTRFIDQIALQIVSSDGDTAVAAGSTIIHDHLRSPETKKVEFLGSGNVYMFPDGEDHFIYENLLYESDYIVNIDLSDSATVKVNGQERTGKNLSFTVHAEEHDDIEIDFADNTVGLSGTVSISPNDSTEIASVSPQGEYLLKADLEGVQNLQLNNTNLEIDRICLLEEGRLISYESFVSFVPGNSITFPFESGQDYYFVIVNNGSSTVHNAVLQMNSDIQSFVPEEDIVLSKGIQAITLLNTYNSEMSFQIVLSEEDAENTISIFNMEGISISHITQYERDNVNYVKYSFALSSAERCYIFCTAVNPIYFTVSLDNRYIKWEIDGDIYEGYDVELPRGASYEMRLLYCKDNYEYELSTAYNYANRSCYFSLTFDGVLTVTYKVPFDYEITIVPIKYPDATLRITPKEGREDIDYTVTLDMMGGTGGTSSVEANFNRGMPEDGLTAPRRPGYIFMGYFSEPNGEGTQYYDSEMQSKATWEKEEDATLYAYWEGDTFEVTFDQNGGTGGTTRKDATVGEQMPSITLPSRTGYTFAGYYYEPLDKCYYTSIGDPMIFDLSGPVTLTARWSPIHWTVIYQTYIGTNEFERGEYLDMTYDQPHPVYGESITAPDIEGYTFVEWRSYYAYFQINDENSYTKYTDKTVTIFNVLPVYGTNRFLTAVYQPACVAEGTLITLADGSQKAVEDLTGDEMLLVWDLYTGTFGSAPILFIDSDPVGHYQVIRLFFSDGTTVDVISEHGFFDIDLNEYVYLDKDAAEYIGHDFWKQGTNGMTAVTLVDVEIETEVTVAYSPVTYGHLCYYVNGMLSMPGGIDGLFNIFEIDAETMTYDAEGMAADIEEYGLYTYEELNALVPVPEIMFDAVNGQYLKVAVGKGMITLEQIGELVDRYSNLFV